MGALVVLHVGLRERPWTHEWFWAIYQLGFVSVFLGPLCAGLGAWEGMRLGHVRSLCDAAGQRWRPLGMKWLAIVAWTSGTYVASLLVVVLGLLVGGILDLPTFADLSPAVVVIALFAAWAAVGLACGYQWPSSLVAPIVAVAAFAFTLVAYTTQPYLVKVGGATASLLFLRARPLIQGAQVAFFAGLVIAALRGLRTDVRASATPPSAILGPALASLGLVVLVGAPGLEFAGRRVPMVCDGAGPRICVAKPYRDRIDWPRAYLVPYLEALGELGIEPPSTFVQSDQRLLGEGSIPDALLLGHPDPIGPFSSLGPGGEAVLGAWLAPRCDVLADPETTAAFGGAERWLVSVLSPLAPDDPTAPEILLDGSTQERGAWLRHQIEVLGRCAPDGAGR